MRVDAHYEQTGVKCTIQILTFWSQQCSEWRWLCSSLPCMTWR